MLFPMLGRELLQFGTITKHTCECEIDERNLKIMNLTVFILKGYKMWGKKQQLSHITEKFSCWTKLRHI